MPKSKISVSIAAKDGSKVKKFTTSLYYWGGQEIGAERPIPDDGSPVEFEFDSVSLVGKLIILGPVSQTAPDVINFEQSYAVQLNEDARFDFVLEKCDQLDQDAYRPDPNSPLTPLDVPFIPVKVPDIPDIPYPTPFLGLPSGNARSFVVERREERLLGCDKVVFRIRDFSNEATEYRVNARLDGRPYLFTDKIIAGDNKPITLTTRECTSTTKLLVQRADGKGPEFGVKFHPRRGDITLNVVVGNDGSIDFEPLNGAQNGSSSWQQYHSLPIPAPNETFTFMVPNDGGGGWYLADSRAPHKYINHEHSDKTLSAKSSALMHWALEATKDWVTSRFQSATRIELLALVAKDGTLFNLFEAGGNYIWHAYAWSEAKPKGARINRDLTISGFLISWVTQGPT
ncbi:MAG: hypothetical protein KDK12_05450 [Rhodobacteraceae bacterium]|nr:hypothetical protein [Paracoccaceae bacterium]